ncbi:MAG: oligosaccharide repeat unit polymerase, partial [Arcobacter sp.]|nr:oligosaccharide repeat unit polymerase [Arcobacter sp.]
MLYVKDFNFIEANAFGHFLNNRLLIKFVSITALGNVFYWLGYSSKFGDRLFRFYYVNLNYKKLLHLDIKETFPKALIIIGLISNFILFSYGAYGRGGITAQDVTGPIKIIIALSSYLEKLSLVGYFLLALIYFKTGLHKTWYFVTLGFLIFFALISGARGPILFIFILTLLPYYYVHRKINVKLIFIGMFALIFAFTIASELKFFSHSIKDDNNEISLGNYRESYLDFREESSGDIDRIIYNSVYYSIMRRLSTVAQGSIAVGYKDTHGIDKTDPKFLKELLTIPLYSIIPRSFTNSYFPSWGQWFRLKVLKQNNDTYTNNITFGAVAYFYLTGKWFFVAFGFFIYGVVLRFSNNILELNSGISFLVY